MRKTILNRVLTLLFVICVTVIGYRLYQKSNASSTAAPLNHNAKVIGKHNEGMPEIGGAFTLITADSKKFTEKNLLGKYSIIYFGYTFCPDICPQALVNISDGINMLPPELREKLQVIFITVDPKRDTPQAIGKYLKIYPTPITGLTGSKEQIRVAKSVYRVFSRTLQDDKSTDYAVDHSSVVYVMGPDGKFCTHFNHQTDARNIRAILEKTLKTKESPVQ